VTREKVWQSVSDSLRKDFGRMLDVRDVRRVRRVAGDAWVVTVVLAAASGDVHVADVSVDDAGTMTPALTADHVIEAVRRAGRSSVGSPDTSELADLGDVAQIDHEAALDALAELEDPIDVRVAAAVAKGDPKSLRLARDLLPRLLADHERRGTTLFTMAEVEQRLGDLKLARGYLEAAAREFADRFDLSALEKAAALALELAGPQAFNGSPIRSLLEQSRARLKPLEHFGEIPWFADLPESSREALARQCTLRTLAAGEMLVAEGEPSRNVFVVKSGLLGVWLEKPSGTSWMIRCCFPGLLLGESSVLGEKDARCTASLRAERHSEVWTLPANEVRAVMDSNTAFARRIADTKQMHRIDSFFSMHETMGQLDVQVRDEMLSCLQRLETFDAETIVMPANEIPNVACLVARGSVGLFAPLDATKRTALSVVEADSFYGVRDAIHRIAPSVTAIAMPETTVIFFDATRLRELCESSPEHVVAVLERLG